MQQVKEYGSAMSRSAIVILSFNHPLHTARAVRSALNLKWPLFLVHNGSLGQHTKALMDDFPEGPLMKHVVLLKNRGYSGGVNEGLKVAFTEHDWAMLLTNDCEAMGPPLIPSTPQVVVPKIFRRSLLQVDSMGGHFEPSRGRLRHCKTSGEFENSKCRYVPGSSFLVHRKVFESCGGMDESLGTYWEDVDWSLRVQEKNFELSLDESWQVLHHVGKTCQKKSEYSIYYFQRNRKKISWKYTKPFEKPKLCFHLAKDWARLAVQLINKKRYKDLRHLKNALLP